MKRIYLVLLLVIQLGFGQKDKNNGVVVLVRLSENPGDRDLAIQMAKKAYTEWGIK